MRRINPLRSPLKLFPAALALSAACIFPASAFAFEHPRYRIEALLDAQNHTIDANEKVAFTNNFSNATDNLYFHIYPNRQYSEKEINFIYRYTGYFKANFYPEGFQSGGLEVVSVDSGAGSLRYEITGEDKTILKLMLGRKLSPGETIEVDISFKVKIPHSYGRFGWMHDIITLTRWYPILCVFDNEDWHDYPFYVYHQPFFSDASYYSVQLVTDKKQKVISSGSVREQRVNPDGTQTLLLESDAPVRDFAIGACENFEVYTLNKEGFSIDSYYLKGDMAKAKQAAECAFDLMKSYSSDFGSYPYARFSIVPSYLGYGGDQSSCLVFIDTRIYRIPGFMERYFDFLISHETGHQWFYNIIGSDEYRQMFMDEGMNSFWLLEHLENKYGRNAQVLSLPGFLKPFVPNFSFRDSTISRYVYLAKNSLDHPVVGELSSFKEPSSIFAITYGKGAAVLGMLEKKLGREVFLRIMKRYTREFRFGNGSLDDFLRISEEESKTDLGEFFEQWLKTSRLCDYAVAAAGKDWFLLENKGQTKSVVEVKVEYDDSTEKVYSWDTSERQKRVMTERPFRSISVDPKSDIVLDLDRTNNYWPRRLILRPVPVYFFAREIPLFMDRDSYNIIAGPKFSANSLSLSSSLSRPYDNIFRVNYGYDFDAKENQSTFGFEANHLFKKWISAGFEIFDYESSKEKQDLSGGKVYLRTELWPFSYGLFDTNDHATLYLIRNRKLESSANISGREDIRNLHYDKKEEAIVGLAATIGRYGPYPDPAKGWKAVFSQEFAGHFLGGRESFWRTSGELNRYYLIAPSLNHKLAARARAGWGEPSDKRLFELGGAEGLRGYSRKSVEGSHMLLGSVEYRMPLRTGLRAGIMDNTFCLEEIQVVFFADAGKSWFGDFGSADFKKDAGIGLRMNFNVLGILEKVMVRFDAAQAINEPKESPHFWLGINHSF